MSNDVGPFTLKAHQVTIDGAEIKDLFFTVNEEKNKPVKKYTLFLMNKNSLNKISEFKIQNKWFENKTKKEIQEKIESEIASCYALKQCVFCEKAESSLLMTKTPIGLTCKKCIDKTNPKIEFKSFNPQKNIL